MKRVLFVLVSMVSAFMLSACSKEIEQICHVCNEACSESASFCPNCGADLFIAPPKETEEQEEEFVDYSDFGFQNNYGMNEWIYVSRYDFSDINNAYIITSYNGAEVLLFENEYLQIRSFEKENCYMGDFKKGKLETAIGYDMVSNTVLSLEDNSTYEIASMELKGDIPIIGTNHTLYRNAGEFVTDGWFIPTKFIDFSKEPEITYLTINGVEYRGTSPDLKYYIKAEYLQDINEVN